MITVLFGFHSNVAPLLYFWHFYNSSEPFVWWWNTSVDGKMTQCWPVTGRWFGCCCNVETGMATSVWGVSSLTVSLQLFLNYPGLIMMTVVFKFKTEMRHNSQAQQELSKCCTFRIGQVNVLKYLIVTAQVSKVFFCQEMYSSIKVTSKSKLYLCLHICIPGVNWLLTWLVCFKLIKKCITGTDAACNLQCN